MSVEVRVRMAIGQPHALRYDTPDTKTGAKPVSRSAAITIAAVIALGFVGWGGLGPEPNMVEARVGIAAGEGLHPLGQIFGGWEPSVWPGRLAVTWAWGRFQDDWPGVAAIRGPAMIAALLIGFLLARGLGRTLGIGAGLAVTLTWFGSLGLMDRTEALGLEFVPALGVLGALNRILTRGSDWVAGGWMAWAFLAGGWPGPAVVALTIIVLGRPGATLSARLLLPPLAAMAAWSAWALTQMPTQAWAAALTLPLTRQPAWWLIPSVLPLALPWTPLALFIGSRTLRERWTTAGRRLVFGWIQVAAAAAIAGTLIPGLAPAARPVTLAGLAVAAAMVVEALAANAASGRARWMTILAAILFVGLAVPLGVYVGFTMPYYRPIAILMVGLAMIGGFLALIGMIEGRTRPALAALVLGAVLLKLGYGGVYLPERDYRDGVGPWGRAIGQWVPPHWPIYTIHTWPTDLAFASGRPFRQLVDPIHLEDVRDPRPKFVLLHPEEFRHWPERAPKLIEVFSFHDRSGEAVARVLARTKGDINWRRPIDRE